jgi:hypothetical protein
MSLIGKYQRFQDNLSTCGGDMLVRDELARCYAELYANASEAAANISAADLAANMSTLTLESTSAEDVVQRTRAYRAGRRRAAQPVEFCAIFREKLLDTFPAYFRRDPHVRPAAEAARTQYLDEVPLVSEAGLVSETTLQHVENELAALRKYMVNLDGKVVELTEQPAMENSWQSLLGLSAMPDSPMLDEERQQAINAVQVEQEGCRVRFAQLCLQCRGLRAVLYGD